MADIDWKDPELLEKYNFVKKPGAPDYMDGLADWTKEQHLQQKKAFRSYFWDRYGITEHMTAEIYEMMDEEIAEMEEEIEDRKFDEAFDALYDDDVLYTARSWLVNLTANNNEIARKMGYGDEEIESFRKTINDLEESVEAEKKALWAEKKDRVTDAAAKFLNKLGPTSKPPIIIPFKNPAGGDNN